MIAFLTNLARRLKSILIAVDDAAAAVVFKDQTDVTISARCGMAMIDRLCGLPPSAEAFALVDLGVQLDRIDPAHCYAAILGDIDRAQAALDMLAPYKRYIAAAKLPVA